MYNNFYLSLHGHISTPQNHSISWRLFYSDSNIAEVESRAGKPVSSRRSNVADCNGKEKDYESGFHYYGARYYWSEILTNWLSVDPMSDKYPSMSPYNYCAWNPIGLVDVNGEDASECDDRWQYNTSTGRLTWVNDDGGNSHQTVEMVHDRGETTVVDQTVTFSGDITNMFDCTVTSSKIDGFIGGGLDIATGVSEAAAGLALCAGISAVSGGTATPLGMSAGSSLVAVGGAQIILGIKDIVAIIDGHPNTSTRYNLMKDACKGGLGFGTSLLKSGQKDFWKSLRSLSLSAGWSYLKWLSAVYPSYKGVPEGATIK